jgi:hypothetical protein
MTFKSRWWYPTALALAAINLVGGVVAAAQGEPMHAGVHGVFTFAFWEWAQRLRARRVPISADDRMAAVEGEVSDLRAQVAELTERLDFAERILAKGSEEERVERK